MLYKRWKAFQSEVIRVEVKRTDWLSKPKKKKELDFRKRLSRGVCKPTNAAICGNTLCGERLVKTRTKILVGKYCGAE